MKKIHVYEKTFHLLKITLKIEGKKHLLCRLLKIPISSIEMEDLETIRLIQNYKTAPTIFYYYFYHYLFYM